MKKSIILIVFLIISTSIYAQKKPKIKGDKDVVTMTNTIMASFNSLEIDDALEVTLVQGEQNGYTLTTDKNLQDIVQFKVIDSVLRIYTSNEITSSRKLEISLDFMNIEHITLKNDAKIEGEGRIESEVLYINAFDSSVFEIDIEGEELFIMMQRKAGGKLKARATNAIITMNDRTDLKAAIVGEETTVNLTDTAQLKLEGDSDSAAFNLKDGAELDAKKMKVSSVNLYASNNADVYVYAGKDLELFAEGKSNIYVYGDPKIEVKGLTDKSKIIKK